MLYINENEENEKELNKLKFENEELQNEIEQMQEQYAQAIMQLDNNKNIIDFDFLLEYLKDNNAITPQLQFLFDMFLKTQVKDNIENYTFTY